MTQNIDDTWENWMHQFMSIMNQFIPNCTLLSKRNLPWLTKPLINSIKKRNLLFKRAKKTGSFRNYKIARNKTLADIRSAKLAYFRKLNPKDSKKFWKAVKFLNKKQKSIPTLTLGDTTASTDREKANLLNSFFHSSTITYSMEKICNRCYPESFRYFNPGKLPPHLIIATS